MSETTTEELARIFIEEVPAGTSNEDKLKKIIETTRFKNELEAKLIFYKRDMKPDVRYKKTALIRLIDNGQYDVEFFIKQYLEYARFYELKRLGHEVPKDPNTLPSALRSFIIMVVESILDKLTKEVNDFLKEAAKPKTKLSKKSKKENNEQSTEKSS